IWLLTACRRVVVVERRAHRGGIEPMQPRKRLDRVGLLDAAVARELDELFFRRGRVEDALVEDRETRPALRHHVRRVARIADALVAETLARAVDDDPALLDRGPRQQAAVRIADCRIALVRPDIAERGAERLAPQHRLAGRAACAEILRAAHLRAEP